MLGRGPKIFQEEQKERLSFIPLAFSKLFNFDCSSYVVCNFSIVLPGRGRLSPYLLSYISCNVSSEILVFRKSIYP